MDEQQLRALKPESDRFLDHYAPLFGHDGNQIHGRRFVQGLLRGGDRRNTENIAEALDGGPARSLQAFVTTGAWKDAGVVAALRGQVLDALGDEDAVWNADETGFPKKGTQSVGVKGQYSGTLGRTDNCQVAVLANYCSARGHAFVDRRLFLPEDWADDADRRAGAGVPEDVIFRTKPALALEMIAGAVAAGVPFRWAGGDCASGDNPTLVRGVRALGEWYVLDISSDTPVWTGAPRVTPADPRPRPARGRHPTKPLVVGDRRRIDEIAAALPATARRRVVVGEGSQGPRMCEYPEVRVWFREDGLPGPAERLSVRRSLGQGPEWTYHRSNAPAEASLKKAGAGTRCAVDDRRGHPVVQGRVRVGRVRDPRVGRVAPPHGPVDVGPGVPGAAEARVGGKRAPDDGARGAGATDAPAGRARLGRRRDPEMVAVASGAQPARRRQSPQASARRTGTAAR